VSGTSSLLPLGLGVGLRMDASDIEALEAELRATGDEIESIVAAAGGEGLTVSLFELRQAEEEMGVLKARLDHLLSSSEESAQKEEDLRGQNIALQKRNETLEREIEELKRSAGAATVHPAIVSSSPERVGDDTNAEEAEQKRYNELEFKLAETRGLLARALQAQEDSQLARELAEKRLEQERSIRLHAEKERDAYSAAYEASLKHFEKWSEKKLSGGSARNFG